MAAPVWLRRRTYAARCKRIIQRNSEQTYDSVAGTCGLKSKGEEAVIEGIVNIAADELKKSGSFKLSTFCCHVVPFVAITHHLLPSVVSLGAFLMFLGALIEKRLLGRLCLHPRFGVVFVITLLYY